METKPLNEQSPVQIPLFLDGIPKRSDELSQENIKNIDIFLSPKISSASEDSETISGSDYLRLSRFAFENGISDEVLKKYLTEKGIILNSNLPPEPLTQITLH